MRGSRSRRGNVVELGEDEQVLVAGEVAVRRNHLRHVADRAADPRGLATDVESGDRRGPAASAATAS